MTINDVYKTIQFIVRKNSTGGAINPDQFNLIINRAQMTRFMRAYGNQQEYQPGKPVPRISFEITQAITDELDIFIKNIDLILDANGQAKYPSDYVHTIPGMRYNASVNNSNGVGSTIKYVPIEIVNKQFESYRLSSVIVNPTRIDPICIEEADYMQFYPTNIGPIKYSYLRQPKDARWGYVVVSGRPVYDPITSVDLEWRDTDVNSIIALACSNYIGISIKDTEIIQFAQQAYEQGV